MIDKQIEDLVNILMRSEIEAIQDNQDAAFERLEQSKKKHLKNFETRVRKWEQKWGVKWKDR